MTIVEHQRCAGLTRYVRIAVVLAMVIFLSPPFGQSASAPAPATSAHWSFQPVRRPEVPLVESAGSTSAHPIDAFLLTGRDEEGGTLAPPADRRTLLRRVNYDLLGLPPTPAEVDAFVADPAPDAFDRVVERLLASRHYGERWGRHWLDVVRYADTAGENTDHPLPHAWRYRNWVIQAFNRDQPYDEFIRDQIAGDLLAAAGPSDQYAERVVATGYLAIARRFGHDIDKDMHLTLEDTIDTLGKSVLGLTLGCARCHDHKNDPVSARDYYGLYGIFESTRFAFPGCEPKQQPRDLVPLWSADEMSSRRKPFEEQMAALDARLKKMTDAQAGVVRALRNKATNAANLLARGEFKDGGEQKLSTNAEPITVNVKTGEMIQLTVLPRANYGADTTVLEFTVDEVAENGAAGRRWNLASDVAGDFLSGNPHADRQGHPAVWCFLDPRKGLQLLAEKVRDLDGRKGLHVWRNGDNPSAFVNSTDEPIKAWTTLPPKTFFVHPAADGPVAVAWLSPLTGSVRITGRVADGHAGGGDGVAWALEHVAADLGSDMTRLASLAAEMREPLRLRTELKAREPRVPVAYAVAEGAVKNTRLQKRGDPEQPGVEVPRKFLDLLGGQIVAGTNQSGRLELAQWLTSPTNPLTARVMVNRIWQGHFGKGLVTTPNDFGRQGRPPTHPALLDWLASEFVRSGWSVKAMHRLILSSHVYQQSSGVAGPGGPPVISGQYSVDRSAVAQSSVDRQSRGSADGKAQLPSTGSLKTDLLNTDFSPFPRRRLSAEELRDTLLAVTGELDRTPGEAHPFPSEDKWSFTQHGPFAAEYDSMKRSVYLMQKRNRRIPFFALFDGADPNASTAKRDLTTVPTQALYFMNDPFVHARAEKFAGQVLAAGHTDAVRVVYACRQLFGRSPTDAEQADAVQFLSDYAGGGGAGDDVRRSAWSALVRVMLASNELLYVD